MPCLVSGHFLLLISLINHFESIPAEVLRKFSFVGVNRLSKYVEIYFFNWCGRNGSLRAEPDASTGEKRIDIDSESIMPSKKVSGLHARLVK